jgi:short-subunit dehydrogenase
VKKAVVVGASSGIGRELSIILAANDYTVAIGARRQELLESLLKGYQNMKIFRGTLNWKL